MSRLARLERERRVGRGEKGRGEEEVVKAEVTKP